MCNILKSQKVIRIKSAEQQGTVVGFHTFAEVDRIGG